LVKLAESKKVDLPELSMEDMQAIDPRISAGVFDVLTVEQSVSSRRSFGGTAPDRVKEQVALWTAKLDDPSHNNA
ncbi:MAG: argininosuccinate lyase, partial [Pseudomonadota bacterium]